MRRFIFIALSGLLQAAGLVSPARADAIDDFVQAEMKRQKIPGLSVVVVKQGRILKAAAYGVADIGRAALATTDTVFRIQSITKQFTATGIMMLVEAGKIHLDDPIKNYLTDLPPTWDKITVRHLLTQTSGLLDFVNEPTIDMEVDTTEEKILQSVAARPLKFEPGSAWDYSNTNYHLLAMIIRTVSGEWYGDFLADRIFKPLGMTRTAIVRTRDDAPGRTRGYELKNERIVPDTVLPPSISSYGGGGIQSTVLDLAKWDAALYSEQLLKRATLEQMWTSVKLNDGTTHPYGFGWEIGEIAQHRRLSHGGNWTGFSAHIDRFVDDRLTVIVLTNLYGSTPAKISRGVAGIYLPDVASKSYRPIADREPAVTARFEDILRRSGDGRLRAEEFIPAVWEYIATHAEQMRRDLASLGAIEKLTLVERTDEAGARSYRYRAQFKHTTFVFHFVLTKDNRIAVMMPEDMSP